jgi:hypothetical protein
LGAKLLSTRRSGNHRSVTTAPLGTDPGRADAALLGDRFVCRPRGQAEVKGFGAPDLWTLKDEAVSAG